MDNKNIQEQLLFLSLFFQYRCGNVKKIPLLNAIILFKCMKLAIICNIFVEELLFSVIFASSLDDNVCLVVAKVINSACFPFA